MTSVTFPGGRQMGRMLAGGRTAVMTGRTRRRDTRMAERGGLPGGGGVTIVARRCSWQVERMFASSDCPVVTAAAGARRDVHVIEVRGAPGKIGVTAITFSNGWQVIGRQTGSMGTVVT